VPAGIWQRLALHDLPATVMTSIILSPHFDDAVLSLGGLVAAEAGRVIVATLFAGTPLKPVRGLWDLCCGFRGSDQAMQERTRENDNSLLACGISRTDIRNYAYLDYQYRLAGAMPADSSQNLEQMIRRDIGALLEECSGTPVKLFAPGLELHPDHALVKQAVLALQSAGAGSEVDIFLYQDLPYSFAVLRGGNRSLERLEAEISRGILRVQRQVVVLSSQHLDTKLEAVKHHASQMRALAIGTKVKTARLGLFRKDLLAILRQHAAIQAKSVGLPESYCEIVYRLG